jgi:hypothetical protein
MPVEYRGFFFTAKDGDYFLRNDALLVLGFSSQKPDFYIKSVNVRSAFGKVARDKHFFQ